MPTYQYRCTECGNDLEAVQKFTDPALTECPECEGALRKVFSAVGVVFKGSGFYATDNRTKGSVSASRSAEAPKTGAAKTDPGAPDSKPAAAKADKAVASTKSAVPAA